MLATGAAALLSTSCVALGQQSGPVNDARVGDMTITGVWVAAAPMAPAAKPGMMPAKGGGATSAAYLVLANRGKTADKLVQAQSDVADAVEIHTTEKQGDVMTMRPVDGVDVPAGGQAKLEPGGFHIMLIGLKRDLNAGDTAPLTLRFQQAGQVTLQAPIRAR